MSSGPKGNNFPQNMGKNFRLYVGQPIHPSFRRHVRPSVHAAFLMEESIESMEKNAEVPSVVIIYEPLPKTRKMILPVLPPKSLRSPQRKALMEVFL